MKYRKYGKYGAVKTSIDGINFDSGLEAARYRVLKMLERVKDISDLELQPKFELVGSYKYKGKTVRAINYIADFKYKRDGKIIVEDVKGMRTQAYILKSKMFIKKYIIDEKKVDEFVEIKRGDF